MTKILPFLSFVLLLIVFSQVSRAEDSAQVFHGPVTVETLEDGTIVVVPREVTLEGDYTQRIFALQQNQENLFLELENARTTVLKNTLSIQNLDMPEGWILYLGSSQGAAQRMRSDGVQWSMIAGFGLMRGASQADRFLSSQSLIKIYYPDVKPVLGSSGGGADCTAGGAGSSACSISCGTSTSCSTTCDPGFYACCKCKLTTASCKCRSL